MLEETDLNTRTTIYVHLLNEGTNVLRPTNGERITDTIFRLLPTTDYDPEDEEWQFLPGTIVRCAFETHEGDRILVAESEVSQS